MHGIFSRKCPYIRFYMVYIHDSGQPCLYVCVWLSVHVCCASICVGLTRTIYLYIRCMYGIFGREITKYTVIYVYIYDSGQPCVYVCVWLSVHVCCARTCVGLARTVYICTVYDRIFADFLAWNTVCIGFWPTLSIGEFTGASLSVMLFASAEFCMDLDSPQLSLPPQPSPSILDHKTRQGMPLEYTEGLPTLRWWPESVFPGFPERHHFCPANTPTH